jgi:ACS family tartrate transporter-like MFS transporter
MLQTLSGYSPFVVTLLSAIPFLATWPFMVWVGWNSDRTRERRWHIALCLLLAGAGLLLTRMTGNVAVGLIGFTLAAMGINGRIPPFWALPNTFLSGASAAAVVGMINCVGNTGGFVGPAVIGFLTDKTGTYTAGMLYLIGSAVVAAGLVLVVKARER